MNFRRKAKAFQSQTSLEKNEKSSYGVEVMKGNFIKGAEILLPPFDKNRNRVPYYVKTNLAVLYPIHKIKQARLHNHFRTPHAFESL